MFLCALIKTSPVYLGFELIMGEQGLASIMCKGNGWQMERDFL